MVNPIIRRVLAVGQNAIAILVAFVISATIVWWTTTTAAYFGATSIRRLPLAVHLLAVLSLSIISLRHWRRVLVSVHGKTQFTLKQLVVGMLLFSLLLATIGRKLHSVVRQETALIRMKMAGGDVKAETPFSKAALSVCDLFGRDPWTECTSIEIRNDAAARELVTQIKAFPKLRTITLGARVTDKGLVATSEAIDRHRRIFQLAIMGSALTDDGLSQLSTLDIEMLFVNGCYGITDDGFEGFQELRYFDLIGDEAGPARRLAITDAGLKNIARMKELEHVMVCGAPITDVGLMHLASLPSLELVRLRNTSVTPKGIEQLKRALPSCKVEDLGSGPTAEPLH